MPFSNLEYLYNHLPTRFRREDKDLFLKRYLQIFGDTLDDWDVKFDSFYASIDSNTAEEKWIHFWLEALFGWSWFPDWFTIVEKRTLYSHFGRHLARRGTRRGIELWLLDFGIVARVHTRTLPWGEFVWGETSFAISEPLYLLVEILFFKSPTMDICAWSDSFWGEFFYTEPKPLFTDKEIVDLIRYVQPHAQEITIVHSLSINPTNITFPAFIDTEAPSVPANLAGNPLSISEIQISFNASTDNVFGDKYYQIRRATNAGFTLNVVDINITNETEYLDSGLATNTTYYYKIRARDASGNWSAYSTAISATTNNTPVLWENLGTNYTLLPDHSAEFLGGVQQRLYTTPRLVNNGDYVEFTVPNHINTYTELRATDIVTNQFLYVYMVGYARNNSGLEDYYSASYVFETGDTIRFQRLSGNIFRYIKNGIALLDFTTPLANAVQISFDWLYAESGDVIVEPTTN